MKEYKKKIHSGQISFISHSKFNIYTSYKCTLVQ